MSYDISLEAELGSGPIEIGQSLNVTYNLSPMFDFLGIDISAMNGKQGGEILPLVVMALKRINDPTNKYDLDRLKPSNGWGTIDIAKEFLFKLQNLLASAPKAIVRVW